MNEKTIKIISVLLVVSIFASGYVFGKTAPKSNNYDSGYSDAKEEAYKHFMKEMYLPCTTKNNLENNGKYIMLEGILTSSEIANKINSVSESNSDLTFAFFSGYEETEEEIDILYVSKSGNPVEIYGIKDLKSINGYTGKVTYVDGTTSSMDNANYDFITVDPISTTELQSGDYDINAFCYYSPHTKVEINAGSYGYSYFITRSPNSSNKNNS